MTQPTLFDALCEQVSGANQVINKEKDNGKDNEKENSPHTPLKGKETGKETGKEISSTIIINPSPLVPIPRARASLDADGGLMKMTALKMQEKCQGLIVSADSLTVADAFMTKMMVYFRVPPNVVRLEMGDVRYLDERDYPSEWDRLMSGHLYMKALGFEYLPDHFNAEGLKVAAFLRQYLRPGRNAAAHRLLITTCLCSARVAKRYGEEVLSMILAACHPVKLRTRKDVWL